MSDAKESSLSILQESDNKKNDLGLVFEELAKQAQGPGMTPLEKWLILGNKISMIVLGVCLLGTAVTWGYTYTQLAEDATIIGKIPFCEYIAPAQSPSENAEDICATLPMIKERNKKTDMAITADIAKRLRGYLDNASPSNYIKKSPEKEFIENKTNPSLRVPIDLAAKAMIQREAGIKSYADGTKITECGRIDINELGELKTQCSVFGWGLTRGETNESSRALALKFIDILETPETIPGTNYTSRFVVQNKPKVMNLEKYSSTSPGAESTLSTRTSLDLQMKFEIVKEAGL